MHFVRMPSADPKYIWSHGQVPQFGVGALPECGAKQLLFSRLCAHYTTVVGAMDADTADIFHALLRVLAAHYVLGGPSDGVSISATLGADHPFDFTDAGLAYLEPAMPNREMDSSASAAPTTVAPTKQPNMTLHNACRCANLTEPRCRQLHNTQAQCAMHNGAGICAIPFKSSPRRRTKRGAAQAPATCIAKRSALLNDICSSPASLTGTFHHAPRPCAARPEIGLQATITERSGPGPVLLAHL